MTATLETRPLPDNDVLGHLLHSLCQPLTTLRCSLELALDEFSERQCEPVSVALEQADRAVETVELMRQYLEIERGMSTVQAVALGPVIDRVLRQLSVVADAHLIPIVASGTSTVVLASNEFWLQRALYYLIGMWLEHPTGGNAITVLLEDGPAGALLSVYSLPLGGSENRAAEARKVTGHLRQAKLEIARLVLEAAGAAVEFCGGDKAGFIIRIPQSQARVHQLSA